MPKVAVYAPGTPMWVDLASPDLEAAKRFYGGLFNWEPHTVPDPQAGGYTMFTKGGKEVAAAGGLQNPNQPPAWSVYIATDNADATAKAVKEAGGRIIAEPFDVMNAGRMAVFQDPSGAFISVWQSGEHKGAELMDEAGAVCWNELATRDIEAAKTFYKKVFGWGSHTSEEGPMPYTEWTLGEKHIGGAYTMGKELPASAPAFWLTYFAVEDADATAKKARELGGKVMAEPQDIPGTGRFAVLTDPQGAAFGILQAAR